jgi:hypothetical protein
MRGLSCEGNEALKAIVYLTGGVIKDLNDSTFTRNTVSDGSILHLDNWNLQ